MVGSSFGGTRSGQLDGQKKQPDATIHRSPIPNEGFQGVSSTLEKEGSISLIGFESFKVVMQRKYIRVSSLEQVEGESLQAQTNEIKEFVKRRDFELIRIHNRSDVKQYLLTGFIRCGKCYRPLYGIAANQRRNFYYSHPTKKYQLSKRKNPDDVKVCEGLGDHIKCFDIEQAVFETIRENTVDEVAFQRAIQNSLPDEEYVAELKKRVMKNEADLKSIEK